MSERAKACRTCFFTDAFPGVEIGDDGVCNLCRRRDTIIRKVDDVTSDIGELRRIAEELKAARTGKYDCLIGASGGLDSSYVIYVAKEVLGLEPIVIKYDHGFNYPIADENLIALCGSLGVDYRIIKSEKGWDRRYVRHMALAFRGMGLFWGVCSFCHWILPAATFGAALAEEVPAILTSSNRYEGNLHMPRAFKMRKMLSGALRRPHRLPAMLWHLLAARYCLLRLKLEFRIGPAANLLRSVPAAPPLRQVKISRYMPWDTDMIQRLLGEHGWRAPDPPRLHMRFDCMIEDSLINSTFKRAGGITVHGIICNNMIFDGTRTREELEEAVCWYADEADRGLGEILALLEEDRRP